MDRTPEPAVLARLGLVFVVIPAAVLAVLYAGSALAGLEFGNVVFGLTIVVIVAWIVLVGSESGGMRWAAASRSGSPFGTDERYAEGMADGGLREYSDPGVGLLAALATVLLGWLVLILSLG